MVKAGYQSWMEKGDWARGEAALDFSIWNKAWLIPKPFGRWEVKGMRRKKQVGGRTGGWKGEVKTRKKAFPEVTSNSRKRQLGKKIA